MRGIFFSSSVGTVSRLFGCSRGNVSVSLLLALSVLMLCAGPALAQVNLLLNNSFETADIPQGWFGITNWSSTDQYGGVVVADAGTAQDGVNYMRMNSFGTVSRILQQRWNAQAGEVYRSDAYMMSPAGMNYFKPTNGYCALVMQFYNAAGTKLGPNAETPWFRISGPTSWTQFKTPTMVAPVGTVTGRTMLLYVPSGDRTTNEYVYFDNVRSYTTDPTMSGALKNTDFETLPAACCNLQGIPFWEGLGNAGGVVADTNATTGGKYSLAIWWQENLLGQKWTAVAGNRYSTSAKALIPTSNPLTSSGTNFALVILEYFDASSNLLVSYTSSQLTTNMAGSWVTLKAEGVAPVNTAFARTLLGVLGSGMIGGLVYFDEVTQQIEASGPSSCGLLTNPGFDDGVPGNVDTLQSNGEFNAWTWLGGTNGGFVQGNFKYDGAQALAITWPHQLAVQTFAAVTGMSYVLEGRIFNPGTERLEDDAYGVLLLQFLSGTNVISTKESLHLTKNSPADTWVYFCVTSRAPSSGSIIGRAAAFLQGDEMGDPNFAGAVYYDAFCVTATNIPFTPTQSGALYNPGFEDSANGTALEYIDNWTAYGIAGALQGDVVRSGNNALQIYYQGTLVGQDWAATAGDKYKTEGYVLTPSANPIRGDLGTNTEPVQAIVVLQFLDASDEILLSYASAPLTPDSPKDVWTHLESIGVAPQGTVKGRTMVGLIGQATNFNGLLYADDLSQSLVWSDAPVYSLIKNAGFDDGCPGNIANLTNTYDLPNWTWLGGTNAGFIQREVIKNEEQAAAITFPNNLLVQEFVATNGVNYVLEGYIQNPTSALMSGTAYGLFLLEFLDKGEVVQGEGTNAVVVTQTVTRSVAETAHFVTGGPSNTWVKFTVTNRAPWTSTSGSIITGRVSATILGNSTNFLGALYFDDMSLKTVSGTPPTNSQAGLLWNPGFEYTAQGTALQFVDNWENFGYDGAVKQTYARSGQKALQVFFTETLAGQTWSVTPGAQYQTEGYVFTPSANPLRGTSFQALVLLQFLNSTGGVIITYPSTAFTTGSVVDAWTLLSAAGVAPANATLGRTMFGVVGTNNDFGGEVWFDDLSQSMMSTGSTTCGLLSNPGFDDGIPGNAYDLDPSSNTNVPPVLDNLPGWSYFGGDNAAFIASDMKKEGAQSLILTYPLNYMVQDFRATGVELLKNKGFEIGAAGGATPTDWFISNALGQEKWAAESGTNGVAFYSWTDGNWGFFGQDVDVDVSKGNVFQFSIRGLAQSNFSSYSSEAYIKVEFWKKGEGSARNTITLNVYPNLIFAPNVWSTYSLTATNTDSQVDMVKVLVGYGDASDTGGDQSCYWDNASLLQGPAGGYTYVASGYMYTPSSARFTTDGSSMGQIQLVYFANETNLIPEFTATSAPFTQELAADTWHYFAVTSTIPFGDNIKGRMICVINNAGNPLEDYNLGGVIAFDSLCLTEGAGGAASAYEQWQIDNFGGTSGPNVGPTEDYDGDTFDNWSEFIAGTDPTLNSSFLSVQSANKLVNGGFVVSWPSVNGRYYTLRRSTNGMQGAFTILSSGIAATPSVNTYTDSVPTSVQMYLYKVSATTNHP